MVCSVGSQLFFSPGNLYLGRKFRNVKAIHIHYITTCCEQEKEIQVIENIIHTFTPVILASASPRRAKLLRQIQVEFRVMPSAIDEPEPDTLPMDPEDIAVHLALMKAQDVASSQQNGLIIGADTVVWNDESTLGKPGNAEKAFDMLSALSGKKHYVTTGVSLIYQPGDHRLQFHTTTEVKFRDLTVQEIDAYIQTGEPMDKAGAYGIQGNGALLVQSITGDYCNVVGVPLARFYLELQNWDQIRNER